MTPAIPQEASPAPCAMPVGPSDELKKVAFEAMCRAHGLCPLHLPHLDKMRWQGEYVARALLSTHPLQDKEQR